MVERFRRSYASYQRRLAVALSALGVLILEGCSLGEVTAAEGEDVLVVEAHLQAARESQTVLLHRSLRDGQMRPERGATVTITGPDGVAVLLTEGPQERCATHSEVDLDEPFPIAATCYTTTWDNPLVVRPGSTYELEVASASGERIRGRTTVPGSFRGRRPHIPAAAFPACALLPRSNLELMWTESQGAWSYLATLEISGLASALEGTGIEAPARGELTGLSISQSDTTLVMPAEFGLFELTNIDPDLLVYLQGGFPPGVTARLRVSALDRNYVNAIRGGTFNPSGAIRISSVVGDGVGVFGSYVPLDLFVVVEVDSPLPPC